jgi:hypothetical protein
MRRSLYVAAVLLTTAGVVATVGESLSRGAEEVIAKERRVAARASGTFEVKLTPQTPDDKAEGSTMGRATIDKTFSGDLQGTSVGQMLTALTDTKGSAGYVAIERVTGSLNGKKGSFVLQHDGIMDRDKPQLRIVVLPDSGTGELRGLTGTMVIIIAGGKHSYEFDYELKVR